ncbi:MAG TPA: hypothetical protein VMW24_03410 [Sedimentisphaerales bacterium]|nr:hypothetical protein [Sedimentisphaerales bacterium]
MAFPAIGMLVVILALLVLLPLKILIFCMIFSKAGYSWALGLLMLIPIANIIMVLILAFGDWPVRRELCQLKQMGGYKG